MIGRGPNPGFCRCLILQQPRPSHASQGLNDAAVHPAVAIECIREGSGVEDDLRSR